MINFIFYTENGSWLTLEAWLIDEELEAVEEPKVKACPSVSLSKAYTMNPLACVSCITTFTGRDMPNEKYREEIGDWVYGCDACQEACPMNKNRWQEVEEFPNLQELSQHISLEKILRMDYKFLEEVMQPKFWYIDKADVWKWKVNAINAMVNNFKDQYKDHIYFTLAMIAILR